MAAIEKDILKRYSKFIENAKKVQRYILVIESANIKKLKTLSEEYSIALKYTANHFKGNSAIISVEDLFEETYAPNQYVLTINDIEATPSIYSKNVVSIIGRRIMMEFWTILPITNMEIFENAFKSTSLSSYLKNYGIFIGDE